MITRAQFEELETAEMDDIYERVLRKQPRTDENTPGPRVLAWFKAYDSALITALQGL